MESCPECKGKVIKEKHELVCEDCGLVLGNVNDEGTGLESKVEVHHPKELGSVIDGVGKEDWQSVPIGQKAQLRRLQQKQYEIKGDRSAELQESLSVADTTGFQNELSPHIYQTAINLFLKAKDNKFTIGRNNKDVFAACIYIACRQNNVPRSFEEIVDISHCGLQSIKRYYNCLTRELNLKLGLISPNSYIQRFCQKINATKDIEDKAYEILKQAEEKGVNAGSKPSAVAASAIYAAAVLCNKAGRDGIKQDDMYESFGVIPGTTQKIYKKLIDKLELQQSLK